MPVSVTPTTPAACWAGGKERHTLLRGQVQGCKYGSAVLVILLKEMEGPTVQWRIKRIFNFTPDQPWSHGYVNFGFRRQARCRTGDTQ